MSPPEAKVNLLPFPSTRSYVQTGDGGGTESGRSISTQSDGQQPSADSPLRLQLGLRALNARRGVEQPILRSTTLKSSASATSTPASPTADAMRPRENSVFTIQLFPFRLGELIERAERYARETLLPLISEQAPRIFRFGGEAPASAAQASELTAPTAAASGTRNARHLKYVPSAAGRPMTGERLMAAAEAGSDGGFDAPVRRQRRIDLPPTLGTNVRIEAADFETAQPLTTSAEGRSLSGNSRLSAPNLLRPGSQSSGESSSRRSDGYYTTRNEADDDGSVVRIALPTYRPETVATPAPAPKVMIVTAIPIPLSAEH